MALDAVHPNYFDMRSDWEKMRDTYRGERHVKSKGAKYLPPTKAMRLDGYGQGASANILRDPSSGNGAGLGGSLTSPTLNLGQEAYDAYVLRAVFPEYVKEAVEMLTGLLHSQGPQIELPDQMEPLRESVTLFGESMEQLLRRINVEQLVAGRLGLLLDLPKNPDPAKPLPYIALYIAEAVTNWDDGIIYEGRPKLNLVVLNESGHQRDPATFQWVPRSKYRVLELPTTVTKDQNEVEILSFGKYRQGVFEASGGAPTYVESDMVEPTLRGTPLDDVPFVFVNSSDIIATPDDPPLLPLANDCLTIYRGEADYRQNLFMQGQDTLVVIGEVKRSSDPNELPAADVASAPLRTGAGSVIHLEAVPGASAEYVGVGATGLSEQRTALENDRKRADAKTGALVDDAPNAAASGEALKTRVAAKTASLNQIAKTGAGALELLLKMAAVWMGADPDKVKITPNLEFADFQLTGDNLQKIMASKVSGAPISKKSIHRLMAQGGLTELDYETEKDELDKEVAEAPAPGTDAGGNPLPAPGGPASGGPAPRPTTARPAPAPRA